MIKAGFLQKSLKLLLSIDLLIFVGTCFIPMTKKYLLACLCCLIFIQSVKSQTSELPVRGLCIAAPKAEGIAEFINFIKDELAPLQINTLILRVDYNFDYQSHPELSNENPLSLENVKLLTRTCQENGIRIIPQINLLGHQSWHSELGNLLEVYPQFDETPWVNLPAEYKWPNDDGLYCKSYCPLHPDVHKVVFELVDELCDAFEADAFHAGLDEVFYLAEDKCPRCGGKDPAELFASEVTKIRNHLAEKDRELWMWGDRLIDGKTTGMGMWEASMNNTFRAIDMIPKDVIICDWHYERPDQTPVYFATKGFRVVTCPWRKPEIARQQVEDMVDFRNSSTPQMQSRYLGMMQTVWTSSENFIEGYQSMKKDQDAKENTSWHCFKAMMEEIEKVK